MTYYNLFIHHCFTYYSLTFHGIEILGWLKCVDIIEVSFLFFFLYFGTLSFLEEENAEFFFQKSQLLA